MVASGDPCCLLCGVVLQDCKYCRNLSHREGLESKELLANSLKQYLESECNKLLDDTFMKFSDVVCKCNCFTSLHKCVRLKKDSDCSPVRTRQFLYGTLAEDDCSSMAVRVILYN